MAFILISFLNGTLFGIIEDINPENTSSGTYYIEGTVAGLFIELYLFLGLRNDFGIFSD